MFVYIEPRSADQTFPPPRPFPFIAITPAAPSPLATSHSPLATVFCFECLAAHPCKFAPLFSISSKMLPPQPFSFHAFASLPGGSRVLTKDFQVFLPPPHVFCNYPLCFHTLVHSFSQRSTRNSFAVNCLRPLSHATEGVPSPSRLAAHSPLVTRGSILTSLRPYLLTSPLRLNAGNASCR